MVRPYRPVLPALASLALAMGLAAADQVVLRDGKKLEGQVLTLDEVELVLLGSDGARDRIPRERVARIVLEPDPARTPVTVEIKNLGSDDALDLWVNGQAVLEESSSSVGWVDVTSMIHPDANEIQFSVLNDQGIWAYRWAIRVGGKTTIYECGRSPRSGCQEGGRDGREIGEIGPLDSVWLYYDEATGAVELQR